ncbi:hypothetical protein D2T29_10705 [Sinirhodobacter populi]|uniref:Uncharacterized protein n=1 Tax=Paenirhodobacter populi TaxID=2306993 RepID=A0A443KFG3_9RHOB|nr:hypothetical protein [Sinirhodobacter populi]RWR31494.1 hypothetical protein D2T29_10705 [Sinirhodobacter populi]
MNRRDLLTAALAAPLPAVPAVAETETETETPVMALFREWNALYDYLNSDEAAALTEEEFDAECDRRRAMELHLAEVPSVGVADFAAKVLALTNQGDHELDAECTPASFWAEARALVGGEA